MKNLALLFILFLFALGTYAQSESETISKANELIADKKYESAFNLLDDFDKKNKNVEIVLLKEKIALDYFVTSMMHQMFAFKDLGPGEDIMDYRGKEGQFGLHAFYIDKVLDSLIAVYPDDCRLYKGLGDFYYDAYLRYNGNWLKNDEELFRLIEKNNKKAIAGNCADYMTYYVMGYIALSSENYEDSKPYFLKSIERDKTYASSHYNLAYAYLFTDDRPNALKYAKNALQLYEDSVYKSDAARMLGQIYTELKDEKNAMESYELADKIDPDNYYNLKPLLSLYVQSGNVKASDIRSRFFNLDPTNPTIYNDLDAIYYDNRKEEELAGFYKQRLADFTDPKVVGSLNFYLAKIYLEIDKKLAKKYFEEAKTQFQKIYKKDHQVFKAIENGLDEAEK